MAVLRKAPVSSATAPVVDSDEIRDPAFGFTAATLIGGGVGVALLGILTFLVERFPSLQAGLHPHQGGRAALGQDHLRHRRVAGQLGRPRPGAARAPGLREGHLSTDRAACRFGLRPHLPTYLEAAGSLIVGVAGKPGGQGSPASRLLLARLEPGGPDILGRDGNWGGEG